MPIRYRQIDHIAIRCDDLERMKQYYSEVFEMKIKDTWSDEKGERIVFMEFNNDQTIELIRNDHGYDGHNVKGLHSHWHCCMETDARHEAYRDLDRKNAGCTRDPLDRVQYDGSWAGFVTDPEGNEWEIMEFTPVSRQIRHLEENMNPEGETLWSNT